MLIFLRNYEFLYRYSCRFYYYDYYARDYWKLKFLKNIFFPRIKSFICKILKLFFLNFILQIPLNVCLKVKKKKDDVCNNSILNNKKKYNIFCLFSPWKKYTFMFILTVNILPKTDCHNNNKKCNCVGWISSCSQGV